MPDDVPDRPRPGGSNARQALGRTLRSFLNDAELSPRAAAAVLRGGFLAVFAGQAVVAMVVALAVAMAAGRQQAPSATVAIVSVAASLGQLLLGVAITSLGVRQVRVASHDRPRSVARRAALSHALLSSVLLSTPVWFAAFGWLTGQSLLALATVVALASLGYGFGMLQLGPLARAVTGRSASAAKADG